MHRWLILIWKDLALI